VLIWIALYSGAVCKYFLFLRSILSNLLLPILVLVFICGYIAIALEHPIKTDKTASALFTGMTCWSLLALFGESTTFSDPAIISAISEIGFRTFLEHSLAEHLFSISSILFFLMGAMTIVEVIDINGGFNLITERVNTTSKRKLLFIIAFLSFFISSALDNLTTTIVMVSLVRKMLKDRELQLYYASIIVLAANAGGAWSVIGDVTTTMLWIGGQVSVIPIMKVLFLPSMICMLIPLFILSAMSPMKGQFERIKHNIKNERDDLSQALVLGLGISIFLFVPVFKSITHLPPFLGMLLGLSILWIILEIVHKGKHLDIKANLSVTRALEKIDTPSILFFLGILLAVSALETSGLLVQAAEFLSSNLGNFDVIVFAIGILSAVVDNVPLVAASIGMYPTHTDVSSIFAIDGKFWNFLAYCVGTGGSLLIIGSAAGVAAMGILKIDFIWYLRKISWLALLGYVGGALLYLMFS